MEIKTGRVTAELRGEAILYNKFGELLEDRAFGNILVSTGIASILCINIGSSVGGTPGAAYIAVGSVKTAPHASQTQLGSEHDQTKGRLLGSYTHPAGSTYYRLEKTFPAGTPVGGITETGMFTKSGRGSPIMLNRGTFDLVQKGSSDTLKVVWTTTFS